MSVGGDPTAAEPAAERLEAGAIILLRGAVTAPERPTERGGVRGRRWRPASIRG